MAVLLDHRYIKKRRKPQILLERCIVSLVNLGRKRAIPSPDQVRAILIDRHNQLGDAVAASPFIEALRSLWPNARVEVLASNDNFEVFSWVQGVDRVHLLPRDANWWQRVRLYRRFSGQFDLVFQTMLDEKYIKRALAARAMAGAGLAVGRARGSPIEALFDQAVYLPAGCYVGQLMALLTPFTSQSVAQMIDQHPRHRVTLPVDQVASAMAKLAMLGLSPRGYVVLNISARMAFRALGTDQAVTLIRQLAGKGLTVVLLHAPADQDKALAIAAQAPAVRRIEHCTLAEAMAIAQHARLYLGADTGTAHFAASGGVPCLVLFSFRARADIWSPYGVPFVSIQSNADQPVSDIDQDLIMAYAERLLRGEDLTLVVKSTPAHFATHGEFSEFDGSNGSSPGAVGYVECAARG